MTELADLPGGLTVLEGLADLEARVQSPAACLAAIAAGRLRDLGLRVVADRDLPEEPELTLYRLLSETGGDGYYQYNARLRELDSFILCLEARRSRFRADDRASEPR